jgi:hypothetical protein
MLLGVGFGACIHRDECACVVSVSDVLCNSKKKHRYTIQPSQTKCISPRIDCERKIILHKKLYRTVWFGCDGTSTAK